MKIIINHVLLFSVLIYPLFMVNYGYMKITLSDDQKQKPEEQHVQDTYLPVYLIYETEITIIFRD